jgi:hypothetical protein
MNFILLFSGSITLMSPRSVFNIILKVLGMFLIKDILLTIPTALSLFVFWTAGPSSDFSFLWGALILLLYGWIAWQLIVRTNWVIDLFKLDRNFQEESFSIGIHRSSVLKIAVIVIGGLVAVDAIPELCREIFIYWQSHRGSGSQSQNPANSPIDVFTPAFKLMIGSWLLRKNNSIVNYIELKRRS